MDQTRIHQITDAYIKYVGTDGNFAQVDIAVDPAEQIQFSHSMTGAAQSTSVPPNTSPAAGAAVSIFSILIARSIHDSMITSKANEKAEAINEVLRTLDISGLIQAAVSERSGRIGNIDIHSASYASKYSDMGKISLHPEIHFKNDMSSFRVKLDASISVHDSAEAIYRNSFEYRSKPIDVDTRSEVDSDQDGTDPAVRWTANDGELFIRELNSGIHEIHRLLAEDLYSDFDSGKVGQMARTIKYSNLSERCFARGILLESNGDRLVYRDLRGHIISDYGTLLTPVRPVRVPIGEPQQ